MRIIAVLLFLSATIAAQGEPPDTFTCPLDDRFTRFPTFLLPGGTQPMFREMEVATDEDLEYVTASGGALVSAANVRAAMIQVDLAFGRDIGLTVRHVSANRWTTPDPYQGATADAILIAFQNYWNENFRHIHRDTAHLFTGKIVNQGLAYVGTVCRSPSNAYGLSGRSVPTLQWIITAHELAHNLGANHVSTPECTPSIMNPVVNETAVRFCDESKREIASYIATFGSCLSPVVTAADITISGKVTHDGKPVKEARVMFFSPDSGPIHAITNAFGFYTVTLQPGDYVAAAFHRRHRFEPRAVSVRDNLTGFDFSAEE